MTLNIRITDEPGEHGTIRTIEVEAGTEDIGDPASFVGDIIHFATAAEPRYRLTTNPQAADEPLADLPVLNPNPPEPDRCARTSCGHDRTDHTDVTQGRHVGTHNGACRVCTETGVESPACWSYVAPMDRPILAVPGGVR
jgi:hypothetical protein